MKVRPLFAGAILLNVVTLSALGYFIKTRPEAAPLPKPLERTIEPAKTRRFDRKQIPNLATVTAVQQTAPEAGAVVYG